MKQIIGRKIGESIIVDDSFEINPEHRWRVDDNGYVCRSRKKFEPGEGQRIYLHHIVAEKKHGQEARHINKNKLDNRRENIKLCSRAEQVINQIRENKTGYRGIRKLSNTREGRWSASVCVGKIRHYLGSYSSPLDAAMAYDRAAEKFHGSYACTNKSLGLIR